MNNFDLNTVQEIAHIYLQIPTSFSPSKEYTHTHSVSHTYKEELYNKFSRAERPPLYFSISSQKWNEKIWHLEKIKNMKNK